MKQKICQATVPIHCSASRNLFIPFSIKAAKIPANLQKKKQKSKTGATGLAL
ncbi:hypothetical protein B4096_1038 [Heyndrickxia coagulans]|nr:hypothetical protein B4100_1053 [Heyndrickxia coagulans]KYC86062.1 hypothetical protein B4096_1038 [Heyndrickxia coagulans]